MNEFKWTGVSERHECLDEKENGGWGTGVQRRPLCQGQSRGGRKGATQSSGVGKGPAREEVVGGQASLSQGEARTHPSLTVLRGNYPAGTLLLYFQPRKQRKQMSVV